MTKKFFLLLALMLLISTVALAQTPKNPTAGGAMSRSNRIELMPTPATRLGIAAPTTKTPSEVVAEAAVR